MKYKVAFFTEGQYTGKIPRSHPNKRTDITWQIALDATHYNLDNIPSMISFERYDIGIIIIPKNNPKIVAKRWDEIKDICTQVAIMQEGPNWYWQDYNVETQGIFFDILRNADFLLCHNNIDAYYYKGLLARDDVYVMQTLMIPTLELDMSIERTGCMIGGTLCSWYGGFDSMSIASEFECGIYAPSMGRKKENEEQLTSINYLPYMNWDNWIKELNKRKYAVHLMRTFAAGTFSLNCAYLGIPCIGYKGINTQHDCHPSLSVDDGDLYAARELANKLKTNEAFYLKCSDECKEIYEYMYSEDVFVISLENIFDVIFKSISKRI